MSTELSLLSNHIVYSSKHREEAENTRFYLHRVCQQGAWSLQIQSCPFRDTP